MPESRPLAVRPAGSVEAALAGTVTAPHAFLPGIDVEADRAAHAADLAATAAGQELSIAVGEGDRERWVIATDLAWDSAFFGRPMVRLDAIVDPHGPAEPDADAGPATSAVEVFLDRCRARSIAHAVAVVAAEDLVAVRALQAGGFELVETRAVYHASLHTQAGERFAVREGGPADVPSLARAASGAVNPFDRFHADLSFMPAEADRLMERWVQASVQDGFADLVLVPDVDAPEAFATAKLQRASWDVWGVNAAQHVLAAVAPKHRGWHVKLIAELGHAVRERGADHLYFTTQITNRAAIRTTEKLGYRYGGASYVFRWVP